MNKLLAAFFFLSFATSISAQTPSLLLLTKDSSFRSCMYMPFIESEGFYDNNVMDRGFINKLYQGGYITENMIDKQLARLNDVNRGGFHGAMGLGLMNFGDSIFGQNKIGMFIRLQAVYDASFDYSQDLFQLIFKGNLSTVDQAERRGVVHGIYQSYQKFGFGFFDKKSLSSASLSLVTGDNYYQSNISTQWTSNSVQDELRLGIGGDFMRSDTSKKGFGVGKGIGVATDIRLNLPLTNGRGVFSFALSDFGAIRWNKQTEKFQLQTEGVWRGVDVGNFFKDSLTWIPNRALKDSLDYLRTTSSRWRMMASSATFRLNMQMTRNGFIEASTCLRLGQSFLPLISLGWTHMIDQHLSITGRVLHGGYSGIKAGLEVQWMPKGKWYIGIGSNQLVGWVSKTATGQGVYLSITKFFFTPKENE